MLHQRLSEPSLGASERAFPRPLGARFRAPLPEGAEEVLYVGGTARLLSSRPARTRLPGSTSWMALLERRVALLRVLRRALAEPGVYVRIGSENELPAVRSLAVVAAGYGVAARKLGAVSLIGPVRMDYAVARSASMRRGCAPALTFRRRQLPRELTRWPARYRVTPTRSYLSHGTLQGTGHQEGLLSGPGP